LPIEERLQMAVCDVLELGMLKTSVAAHYNIGRTMLNT
jgi:hypothetical protein